MGPGNGREGRGEKRGSEEREKRRESSKHNFLKTVTPVRGG